MKAYRSRPSEVLAVQLTPGNMADVAQYVCLSGGHASVITYQGRLRLRVVTSKGPKLGRPGGYLVAYPDGRFYPVGDRKFRENFTPASEPETTTCE